MVEGAHARPWSPLSERAATHIAGHRGIAPARTRRGLVRIRLQNALAAEAARAWAMAAHHAELLARLLAVSVGGVSNRHGSSQRTLAQERKLASCKWALCNSASRPAHLTARVATPASAGSARERPRQQAQGVACVFRV
jgi:hypothetical protein